MDLYTAAEKKEMIRKSALDQRNALKKEQVMEFSEQIKKQLFVLDEFSRSKVVMFYSSFQNEVHTHGMINESLLSRKVLLPKMSTDGIVPSLILSMENLIEDNHGILGPIEALPVKHSTIDCVIVPGVAFDSLGHRLGFGKGNYDRFLRKATHAVKIGLAFDCQVVDPFPIEAHDVPMDIIVTPTRVIRRH